MKPHEARQLSLRSGFLGSDEEITALERQGLSGAVERLVVQGAGHRLARHAPPGWVNEALSLRAAKTEDRMATRQRRITEKLRLVELMGWWMQEMLTTPAPLVERMTLFWHGHFATSAWKVRKPQLMYRQNAMLRRHALGNYRDLLRAVARDPAMVIYLDSRLSRKKAPNENFARELLELFTLGEGHYSEVDIRQAARAFTGWTIDPDSAEFTFMETNHDDGEKQVFGQKGNFGGDEVIDLILQQPHAAKFIVERLWAEFVSPQPEAAAVQKLATRFRRDWEIAPLLQGLLMQAADPAYAGQRVKAPVELVVGTLRWMQVDVGDGRFPAMASASMEQILFNPPNVRGWPGGVSWITSNSLLARQRFLRILCGDDDAIARPGVIGSAAEMDILAVIKRDKFAWRDAVSRYAERFPPDGADRFLTVPPVQEITDGLSPQERMRAWLLDPAYQVS